MTSGFRHGNLGYEKWCSPRGKPPHLDSPGAQSSETERNVLGQVLLRHIQPLVDVAPSWAIGTRQAVCDLFDGDWYPVKLQLFFFCVEEFGS